MRSQTAVYQRQVVVDNNRRPATTAEAGDAAMDKLRNLDK
jgi:hypothetical protein